MYNVQDRSHPCLGPSTMREYEKSSSNQQRKRLQFHPETLNGAYRVEVEWPNLRQRWVTRDGGCEARRGAERSGDQWLHCDIGDSCPCDTWSPAPGDGQMSPSSESVTLSRYREQMSSQIMSLQTIKLAGPSTPPAREKEKGEYKNTCKNRLFMLFLVKTLSFQAGKSIP